MFLSLIYQGCLSGFFELLLLDVQVRICTFGATYIKLHYSIQEKASPVITRSKDLLNLCLFHEFRKSSQSHPKVIPKSKVIWKSPLLSNLGCFYLLRLSVLILFICNYEMIITLKVSFKINNNPNFKLLLSDYLVTQIRKADF